MHQCDRCGRAGMPLAGVVLRVGTTFSETHKLCVSCVNHVLEAFDESLAPEQVFLR